MLPDIAPGTDISAFAPATYPFGIIFDGLERDELRFTLYCRQCGGFVLTTDDAPATDTSMMYCKGCGEFMGRRSQIQAGASETARRAGLPASTRREGATWYRP